MRQSDERFVMNLAAAKHNSLLLAVLSLATCLSAFGQVPWHFEFDGGLPVKLVWQTQPGQTYNLRETTNLFLGPRSPDSPRSLPER